MPASNGELNKMRLNKGGGLVVYPLMCCMVYVGHYLGLVSYAVLILAYCMTISGMIMTLAMYEPEKNQDGTKKAGVFERLIGALSGEGKYDNESMTDLVTSFQMDAQDVNDSYLLLTTLKKKLRKSQIALLEAASMGLVKTSANFVKGACSDDKRIIPSLDVINTILSNPNACAIVRGSEAELKEIADSLVEAITTHMRPESELELSSGKKSEIEAKTDELLNGNGDDINNNIDDEEEDLDFDFSDKVTKKPLSKYFCSYGFKIMMALGLLAADEAKVQTVIGDKGAIKALVDCLVRGSEDPQVVKWACWATINLVYEHPPNKREFFLKGGLDHLITGARRHTATTEVFQQSVALLLAMIAYDQHTKMNQSAARQSCLANGIFEVLQEGKKHAPDNQELHNMIDQVLKLLISDWS